MIYDGPVVPITTIAGPSAATSARNLGTGCGATPLAADAAQGQTTIQLASTSGFSVGQWVLIDEASGAGWVPDPLNAVTGFGSVWAAPDWLSPSGSPATGRVMWSKIAVRKWRRLGFWLDLPLSGKLGGLLALLL